MKKKHNVKGVIALDAGVPIREEMHEGRKYLVAPVVAMVEGVHQGAAGTFLYTAQELSEYAVAWNGVPLPVFHPQRNGEYVTANDPQILEEQSIGRLFNVRFDVEKAKLIGEVWIDINKAQSIEPAILDIIRSGNRLEVSTGLYSDDDGKPGTWNGESYEATVMNIRPDHLALLPGGQGACSWADGCGVRAQSNNRSIEQESDKFMKKESKVSQTVQAVTAKVLEAVRSFGMFGNESSHEEMRSLLQRAVDALDNESWMHFVVSVYDDFFVYEARGNNPNEGGQSVAKLYKRGYSVDDENQVTLAEELQEVVEEINYVPVANTTDVVAEEGKTTSKENIEMERKDELIQSLIACECTRFDAGDEDWLKTMEVAQLEKLEAVAPKPNAPETPPETPSETPPETPPTKANTVEEYIDKAPPEIQSTLVRAMARDKSVKDTLVATLIANERCEFTKEALELKGIGELEHLTKLADVPVDFKGQSGGPPVDVNEDDKVPAMPKVFEDTKVTA